jgi:PAS domain S-box-containing protein
VSGINISKKVLIITLFIFFILTAAFTFTHNLQLSNFLVLEENDALKNIGRVENAVFVEQTNLDYLVADWACWNEAYTFVLDRNRKFIDETILNQTLSGLKLNVVIFVNNSGSVVFAKSVDLHTGEENLVPKDLLKLIENGKLTTKSDNETISGIVLLDEDPMFVSCHSILKTNMKGPMRGTLIFGRYFDSTLLKDFQNTTRYPLLMYRVDRYSPPDFQDKINNFSEFPDKPIINTLSENKIAGYFALKDTSGRPALILRADFPRDLYLRGEKTLYYMYLFLLMTGLMTGVGVKIALDKLFVSRLIEIDDFVAKVRSEKDLSKRLTPKDNDELYRLSREINEMLNEIYMTEQELKEQEREKKVLLDSLNELVVFINPNLNIIWANKAALEFMKKDLQEIVGLNIKLAPVINGLSEYMQFEQIFVTGSKNSGEFVSKDGRVWIVQAIPVTEESGKIIGVLETCREITERKTAEKLLQEKQIAEVANRTKSEFLANMSHELRTPLNSIIGFSDLLYEQAYGTLSEKQLKAVGNISKSGRHLLRLINDVLDLSKVEAGKLELNYKDFNLAAKLNMIQNLMAPIADRKNIQIIINMDTNINSICADEDKFIQVMYNLVDNAIKFSYENGLIKIGAREKGELLEITVSDNGIGVKAEDHNKIFKPFSQVDSFFSKSSQGTGLGLSLVKQIVHLHGGYVWFRSNIGKGSTFAFTIPINGRIERREDTDLNKKNSY